MVPEDKIEREKVARRIANYIIIEYELYKKSYLYQCADEVHLAIRGSSALS